MGQSGFLRLARQPVREIVESQRHAFLHSFRLRLALGIITNAGIITCRVVERKGERAARMIDGAEGRHAVQLGQPFLLRSLGRPEDRSQYLVLESQQQLHAYVLTDLGAQVLVHAFHLLVQRQGIVRQLAAHRCSHGVTGNLPTFASPCTDGEHIVIQLVQQFRHTDRLVILSFGDGHRLFGPSVQLDPHRSFLGKK